MAAKENACHMLFLGMCMTLREMYKVTKQGKNLNKLKSDALRQILDNRYYTG